MGQQITVVEKASARRGVVRFELNRSLTGMGHERYASGDEVDGRRPVDEMARRMLAHGGIERIHVYGNVVTVDLEKGCDGAGLADLMRELFVHYLPGVVPPTDEELLAQTPTG